MRAISYAAVAALAGTLAACGGGGGGGGGGAGVSMLPTTTGNSSEQPASVQSAPAPDSNVTVAGAKRTADNSGAFAVKPGDVISIQVGTDVLWTSTSEVADTVKLQNLQAGNRTWSAALLHDGSTEHKLVLTAKYGSGANDVLTFTFKVAAADARNGTYHLFSAAGTEFNFKVNFDLKQFALLDRANASIRSGALANDPTQEGTYLMVDDFSKLAASNNARFRVNADALVGALPVPIPFANPQNINMAYPFVATRTLVTDKTALDGFYNRLDLTLTPGTGGSSIPSLSSRLREIQIAGQGATLDQCNETNTISRLASCTGAGKTLVHYTASAVADADGRWTFTNNADASDKLIVAVARIGGENVLLEAGADALTPANHVFRIGVPNLTAWKAGVAYGGSVTGDWSKYRIGMTNIDVDSTALAGTTYTESYPLTDPTVTEPQGWKKAGLMGGGIAFAIQSKGLYMLMGSPSSYNGYVQLGLLD